MKFTSGNIILQAAAIASALSALQASALPADYYANHSRLSSGKWVKIKVTETGVQRISHDQIRKWGFSDPSKVRVYGFSGVSLSRDRFTTSMPDDVPLQYSEHIDDALYFYGEGDHRVIVKSLDTVTTLRNYYSTYSCYFLSDAEPDEATTASPVPFSEAANSSTTHWAVEYQEREEFSPGTGGSMYFSNKIEPGAGAEYSFTPSDVAAQMCLIFEPVARTQTRFAPEPELSGNVTKETRSYYPNIARYIPDDAAQVICSPLPGRSYQYLSYTGNGTVTATFKNPEISGCSFLAMDYVALSYVRYNRLADHGQMLMHYGNRSAADNITLTETTAGTRVWNVTEPLSVVPLETRYDDATSTAEVSPGVSGATDIAVFNPGEEGMLTPQYVETVANTDLHAHTADVDMVIITIPSLISNATKIADIHRAEQGLNVRVVNHLDIFNEFSSGTPSAIAYRRYLKMLHDRNPGKLRFLLLLGTGSYDNRRIIVPDNNYLMTYQCTEDRDNLQGWYTYEPRIFSSDNYFGMLDDSFQPNAMPQTPTDLAVGRIPVSVTSQAELIVDNIRDYYAGLGMSDNHTRLLMMSDASDKYAHFNMAENGVKLALEANPALAVTRAYHYYYQKGSDASVADLVNQMAQRGTGLMAFAGHGSAMEIGNPSFINRSTAPKMKFGSHPFMMLATCSALNLDRFTPAVGNCLLTQTNGPVGIVASGRTVYLSKNKVIFDNFISGYYKATEHMTIGEVWRDAFNTTVTTMDKSIGLNTLCYNLGGDPALPIETADHTIRITQVNGAEPTGSETVAPLEKIHLEGVIDSPDGTPADKFNGSAIITVLEAPRQVSLFKYDSSDTDVTGPFENDVLTSVGAKVTGGKWSADITLPIPATTDAENPCRVILSASNTTGKLVAKGIYNGLTVTAATAGSGSDDTTGPKIAEMYLDSPDFVDGDPVNPSTVLHAIISPDPSGIATSTAVMGHNPMLTLDGTTTYNAVSRSLVPTADSGASLTFNVTGLAPGEHELELTVCDNAGNRNSRMISFVVIDDKVTGRLSVTDEIITDCATISFDAASTIRVSRMIVLDAAGNTVETVATPTFPYIWTPAASLPDGNYRVRAFLSNGTSHGVSDDLDLILIRR